MTARVAVVIPAYEAEEFLGAAVRSVQCQTLEAVELVVVDDGSSDRTAEVAEQLGARVLRQENSGPGAARNAGVAATTAPYLAFLDADDWFAPEKLARQVAWLEGADAAACATDAWVVRNCQIEGRKNARRSVPPVLTVDALLGGNPIVCSSVVVRRDAFDAVGGFDPDRALIATEDYDLWLRLAERSPIAYLDDPLAFYTARADGLSDNATFMAGVDRILEKFAASGTRDPHTLALMRKRRGGVRLDLAWDALQRGEGSSARDWLRQAREEGVGGWRAWKMRLRSYLRL